MTIEKSKEKALMKQDNPCILEGYKKSRTWRLFKRTQNKVICSSEGST